jgi:23S rRNA (uracil1939-C5)-methyltransferase
VVEADVVGVLSQPHPARLADPCPHAPDCGGCDWSHIDASLGASLKAEVAAESVGRHLELADRLRHAPVRVSPSAYRLRNRLHWDPASVTLGFYAAASRRVGPISGCRIITTRLAQLLPQLTATLARRCPEAADLEWLEGDDGVVVALVPAKDGPEAIPQGWLPAPSECRGIDGFHRLTAHSRVLPGWGRDQVTMALPIPLSVPVGSFFQGNRHLVPWLFERVAHLIGPGDSPAIDLHAGVGFLAAAARWAGRNRLTAVEPDAVSAGAAARNLDGARVVVTTAEAFLARSGRLTRRAVAITDPPRTGLSARLRDQLSRWRPERLLMLGCDPATWGRDAHRLIECGYRCTHLELVDLFPFTHHVEVLAVLETA